jgi:predicted metal-dependent HD superfamily phosphohydrolase
MNYRESLQKVSAYALQYFIDHPHEHLYYHNLSHTMNIIDAVNKINAYYHLEDRDYFIVCAAVWFHDTGILTGGLADHETQSAALARSFLETIDTPQPDIEEISNCILSTRLPQRPVTLLEKIICDADLFNLGTDTFLASNKSLKKETEAYTQSKISGREWKQRTIDLFKDHHYHTEFCQSLLSKTKIENFDSFKRKLEEQKLQSHPANASRLTPEEVKISDLIKSKKVTTHHLRGVETMFRNSSSNHQRLSVMGDNKAFIMITVNSIIISVALGLIIGIGKLVLNPRLVIPTIILVTVNVVTIIYAVVATRPKIMSGTFTRKDVETKKVNLLFFGSFYKMPLEEFEYGMRQMMDDSEFLYGSLIKDIYWQGKVLGRKFRLLRISYDIFMYGTAASVLSYILASVL